MDIQEALAVVVAEIRRLESAIKVAEDPLPLIEALAMLHAVRVATVQKLAEV